MLKILRIEIDGHFHGSADVPKPWVAEITGVDAQYGLARTFVHKLNDYRGARRAHSGNLYGVVAAFPLHEKKLYEVCRLRGKSSKRHLAREFRRVEAGTMIDLAPIEALAIADPWTGAVVEYTAPEGTRVFRVEGLGTPAVCGFVLVDRDRADRQYRLRADVLHEVDTGTDRYLVIADGARPSRISPRDALTWLSTRA